MCIKKLYLIVAGNHFMYIKELYLLVASQVEQNRSEQNLFLLAQNKEKIVRKLTKSKVNILYIIQYIIYMVI